jgi:hypothetical protein
MCDIILIKMILLEHVQVPAKTVMFGRNLTNNGHVKSRILFTLINYLHALLNNGL